jgi:hypothetical protein
VRKLIPPFIWDEHAHPPLIIYLWSSPISLASCCIEWCCHSVPHWLLLTLTLRR